MNYCTCSSSIKSQVGFNLPWFDVRSVSWIHLLMHDWYECRVKDMYYHVNDKSNLKSPLIAEDVYDLVMKVRDNNNSISHVTLFRFCHVHYLQMPGSLLMI